MFYYNKNHNSREYYKMIEINGNIFKSKFNSKEQMTFVYDTLKVGHHNN